MLKMASVIQYGTALNSKLKFLIKEIKITRDIVDQQLEYLGDDGTSKLYNYLHTLEKKLENVDNILPIQQKKIKKRIKKRHYKKRMQALKLSKAKESKVRQQKINEEINKKLERLRNEYEESQAILKIKASRHAALVGVNLRIADADKYISMLISIKTLRHLRKSQMQLPDFGEARFNQTIDQIISVWTNAKLEYEHEKSLIESNFKLPMSVKDSWCQLLFGELWKTWKESEKQDQQKFLKIRRQWDYYTVGKDNSEGSSIPIGWIIPKEDATDDWRCYCSK